MLNGIGDLAFQFGLLDELQKAFVDSQTEAAVANIQKKDFYSAFLVSTFVSYYTDTANIK